MHCELPAVRCFEATQLFLCIVQSFLKIINKKGYMGSSPWFRQGMLTECDCLFQLAQLRVFQRFFLIIELLYLKLQSFFVRGGHGLRVECCRGGWWRLGCCGSAASRAACFSNRLCSCCASFPPQLRTSCCFLFLCTVCLAIPNSGPGQDEPSNSSCGGVMR